MHYFYFDDIGQRAMIRCFLGLGGNICNPLQRMKKAFGMIQSLKGVFAFNFSHFYLTTPQSSISQNFYINAVCSFLTHNSAEEIFIELNAIEKQLGKKIKPKDQPRPIDIDFLFYGNQTQKNAYLTLPHPRLYERRFVLEPLSELTALLPVACPKSGENDVHMLLNGVKNNQEICFVIEGKNEAF